MEAEHEPNRRHLIAGMATALTGAIIGLPKVRADEPDLTFVAEEWLADARALGTVFTVGPDDTLWRSIPIYDGKERAAERERIWVQLQERPRLLRAVYAVARQQFEAQIVGVL